MNKTINIIYSEHQRNVFLEVESVLVNLINHQGKESARLNYISASEIKNKDYSIPSGIILSNNDLIDKLLLRNSHKSKPTLKASLCSSNNEEKENVLLFTFKSTDHEAADELENCFKFLHRNKKIPVNILVKNAAHLKKVEKQTNISLHAKQYPDLKLNFIFAEDLEQIKSFRFETILSFLDEYDLNKTVNSKGYSISNKPLYINGSSICYPIDQSENGLGSINSYFNDLSTLIFLLNTSGLFESASCLKIAIDKVKDEYKYQIENPLDIYRFGEMISYAIEDGDSYCIAQKGQHAQFGIII